MQDLHMGTCEVHRDFGERRVSVCFPYPFAGTTPCRSMARSGAALMGAAPGRIRYGPWMIQRAIDQGMRILRSRCNSR